MATGGEVGGVARYVVVVLYRYVGIGDGVGVP